MSDRNLRLGGLQLRILQVLWRQAPQGVADVQQSLDGEPLAYTTVATMLRKMEDRGLVRHRSVGRKFLYEPAVTAEEVSQPLTEDLVDRVFDGSLSAAVNHLLESREVDAGELDRLEALIRQRREES